MVFLQVSTLHCLVSVTRLVRIAYGDYQLDTIPPGLAIEVPIKPIERQKRKGSIFRRPPDVEGGSMLKNTKRRDPSEHNSSVQWMHYR